MPASAWAWASPGPFLFGSPLRGGPGWALRRPGPARPLGPLLGWLAVRALAPAAVHGSSLRSLPVTPPGLGVRSPTHPRGSFLGWSLAVRAQAPAAVLGSARGAVPAAPPGPGVRSPFSFWGTPPPGLRHCARPRASAPAARGPPVPPAPATPAAARFGADCWGRASPRGSRASARRVLTPRQRRLRDRAPRPIHVPARSRRWSVGAANSPLSSPSRRPPERLKKGGVAPATSRGRVLRRWPRVPRDFPGRWQFAADTSACAARPFFVPVTRGGRVLRPGRSCSALRPRRPFASPRCRAVGPWAPQCIPLSCSSRRPQRGSKRVNRSPATCSSRVRRPGCLFRGPPLGAGVRGSSAVAPAWRLWRPSWPLRPPPSALAVLAAPAAPTALAALSGGPSALAGRWGPGGPFGPSALGVRRLSLLRPLGPWRPWRPGQARKLRPPLARPRQAGEGDEIFHESFSPFGLRGESPEPRPCFGRPAKGAKPSKEGRSVSRHRAVHRGPARRLL